MFKRTAPAFAAGIIFAAATGAGVTYAANDGGDAAAKKAPKYASIKAATRSYDASGYALDLDKDGYTDAYGAYAECPPGTQVTGGGPYDATSTGYIITSSPDVDGYEAWVTIVGILDDETEGPDAVWSTVTCWSPSGQPRGGYRVATTKQFPQRIIDKLAERVTMR